jgi:hypothetical protein
MVKCELFKSKFEYWIDPIEGTAHFLDLNEFGTRTITNNMSRGFISGFINQENLKAGIIDFEIYCYGTDGIVSRYIKEMNNFLYVPIDSEKLYKPFAQVMQERQELRKSTT